MVQFRMLSSGNTVRLNTVSPVMEIEQTEDLVDNHAMQCRKGVDQRRVIPVLLGLLVSIASLERGFWISIQVVLFYPVASGYAEKFE